jgi:hypothetical protein
MLSLTKTLMAFTFISFLITSCGSKSEEKGGIELCECVDINISNLKEQEEVYGDMEKTKVVFNKYKDKLEKCSKLHVGKKLDPKLALPEEMKKCPSYKELEKILKK